VGEISEELLKKLFSTKISDTERELKKDDMYYKAKIYNQNNPFQQMIKDINSNCSNNKRNNIILCFCKDEENINIHVNYWTQLINEIAGGIREVNYPLIIILNPLEDDIKFNDIFQSHRDRRTITILRTMKNNSIANIEHNYRLILSLFWEKNLYLNQKEIKPNKNFNANYFRINSIELTSSVKILLTGFTRTGKSTFLNLIFEKLISRESPQGFPLTNVSNEHSILPNNNNLENQNDNEEIFGGLKIIDTPGIIAATNENQNNIIKIINDSIKKKEESLDVINYIFFFLTPGPNYQNTQNFFIFLNKSAQKGIKILFIINRDKPRKNDSPNTTKETLIDYLEQNNWNNLLINEGENIIEVDLIEGNNEDNNKINKIFTYIYDDLINQNNYIKNPQLIENLNEQELINYLHNNSSFYSQILTPNDIINRGDNRASKVIYSHLLLIFASGFSPIPLVDIPLFIFFLSTMIVSIIIGYGFSLRNFPYGEFFSYVLEDERARLIIENNLEGIRGENGIEQINQRRVDVNEEERERSIFIKRFLESLLRTLGKTQQHYVRIFAYSFLTLCVFRITTLGVLGVLDVSGLFFVGGIVAAIINVPFSKKLETDQKNFVEI
jgi:GTPase Era involved in 16S rRNA processing